MAGHILTNEHVVRGCAELRVPPAGVVAVAALDEAADLALLAGPAGGAVAAFRQGRGIRAGAGVVVVGYPLRGVLASGANVTAGIVSALAGPGDDRRLIQITAPVQPGNSGGPVLDSSGNAVGVVVSKLDAIAMAQATGDIPQNVNFAVGAGAARAFLDAEGVAYETAPSEKAAPAGRGGRGRQTLHRPRRMLELTPPRRPRTAPVLPEAPRAAAFGMVGTALTRQGHIGSIASGKSA